MFKLALPVLFIASFANAHIEPGTYKGKMADGTECSLIAKDQYFENDMHHPLNERINVEVAGTAFKVGHPPVIDASKAVAYFNHDVFQGVFPTPTGAKALEITMVHTEEKEGPSGFTLIENFWKTGVKTSVVCENIELVK